MDAFTITITSVSAFKGPSQNGHTLVKEKKKKKRKKKKLLAYSFAKYTIYR